MLARTLFQAKTAAVRAQPSGSFTPNIGMRWYGGQAQQAAGASEDAEDTEGYQPLYQDPVKPSQAARPNIWSPTMYDGYETPTSKLQESVAAPNPNTGRQSAVGANRGAVPTDFQVQNAPQGYKGQVGVDRNGQPINTSNTASVEATVPAMLGAPSQQISATSTYQRPGGHMWGYNHGVKGTAGYDAAPAKSPYAPAYTQTVRPSDPGSNYTHSYGSGKIQFTPTAAQAKNLGVSKPDLRPELPKPPTNLA